MPDSTAIVKVEDYRIIKMDPGRREVIVRENIGALGVSQFDLDRAKIPSGGITKFEVPTLEGSDMVDSITGVIIGHKDVRVYWKEGMDEGGGGTPPDCFSDDCMKGKGDPGGLCNVCPFAQFGSAAKGKGQACSQRRLLFIARTDSILPLVVNLAPTSLGNARKYFLRLVDRERPFYGVVTSIGLEKDKNSAGIEYAKATFKVVQLLPEELVERFAAIVKEFKPHLTRVAADAAIVGDEQSHGAAPGETVNTRTGEVAAA